MVHDTPPPAPKLSPEELAYNNKDQILGIVYAFTIFALITVLARVYVRVGMLKVFGGDDWVMILAMLCSLGTLICFTQETKHGLGKHFLAIPPSDVEKFFYIRYWHNIIVMLTASLVKISVGAFLLRLAQRHSYRKFLWGMIIFLILYTMASAGTLIFPCIPVKANWDLSLRPPYGNARCFSKETFTALGLTNSAINTTTDLIFAFLPVPLLWKLQINRRQKVSLMLILSLGFFACAAAIAKVQQQVKVLSDPDWTTHDWFEVWFDVEGNVGIVAGTLPTLKPLFGWFLDTARSITTRQSVFSSSKGSGNGSQGTTNTDPSKTSQLGTTNQATTQSNTHNSTPRNNSRGIRLGNFWPSKKSKTASPEVKKPDTLRSNPFNFELATFSNARHSVDVEKGKTSESSSDNRSSDSTVMALPHEQGFDMTNGIMRKTEVTIHRQQ